MKSGLISGDDVKTLVFFSKHSLLPTENVPLVEGFKMLPTEDSVVPNVCIFSKVALLGESLPFVRPCWLLLDYACFVVGSISEMQLPWLIQSVHECWLCICFSLICSEKENLF